MLAEVSFRNGCMEARAIRLRFNLRHDSPRQRELSTLWEKVFLEHMAAYQRKRDASIAAATAAATASASTPPPDPVQLSYSASESLDIELGENVGSDTEVFILTIIIMLVYVTFVSR